MKNNQQFKRKLAIIYILTVIVGVFGTLIRTIIVTKAYLDPTFIPVLVAVLLGVGLLIASMYAADYISSGKGKTSTKNN